MKSKLKIIKKLFKIAGILALILISLPVTVYFLLQWPAVQTYLTQQIAKQVSYNLNARFEVGKVDIVFFNRFLLRNIHIEDQQGDTLLKAERVLVTVQRLDRAERNIVFNHILLHKALINLRSDKDSVMNFRFIIDEVRSDDTTKTKWDFAINSVHFRDSEFSYRRDGPQEREYGVNFQDIRIRRLNFLANKIHTTEDSVHFNISYLNLQEKSGFSIDHFASVNTVSSKGIDIRNLQIITPLSRLDLNHLYFNLTEEDALKDFVNLVGINSRFNPSALSFSDIAYFAPGLRDFDLELILSGDINGSINNLKGKDIKIRAFSETSMLADINMIGLPDFRETFIFLDLQSFMSSAGDIMRMARPGFDIGKDDIPASLGSLGKLSYRGKFTGFIDDFVSYGEFRTELGTLMTDLSLQPDADNILGFNGRLKALDLDAGSLSGSGQIGRISFNADLNGHFSPRSGIYADLEGIIDSVYMFGYNYRHIKLTGELADRKFTGTADIDDPNILLHFTGIIDLSEEIPVFDFFTEVSGARMYDLSFDKEEKDFVLDLSSTANFRGNNIDNLNGMISLENATFTKPDHVFIIDNMLLEATGKEDQRQIILSSDLADAVLTGNYQFTTLVASFNQLISNYLPSYSTTKRDIKEVSGNNFSFSVHIKELSGFTGFFFPDLSVAPGTKFEGVYDPAASVSEITGFSEEFRIGNHTFKNISLETHSGDSLFRFISGIDQVIAAGRFTLENINLNSAILNDNIHFEAEWDNKEEILYKGQLCASATFSKVPESQVPLIEIDVLPSMIIISDSTWYLGESRLLIDSSSYQIDNFVFGHENQNIRINGKLSENPDDSLHLEFHNLDLQNLELLTPLERFHISGVLKGSASLADIHNNPVFSTDLEVKELFLNHQDFGDLSIITKWNNVDRNILVNAFSDRGPDRIINIEGSYLPEVGRLDFDLGLNKINMRTFDGYLDNVFANLRGIANGELKIEGNIRQPLFNGEIYLQKASFMVDYLKTQYNFTHNLKIINNNIVFNDLIAYDPNHNTCRVNGSVNSNYFRDFNLNIYLYPDHFLALNTTERDNDQFYGRVNATGLVHISGPVKNIMMNISARTNRNTQFYIPLQKSSELGELYFLNFTSDPKGDIDDDAGQKIIRYEAELSGLQLNFDLDVTPDAEVQIIFDSKIGDIIRGRGSGSFKMEINTLGQFNMFGEYTIEQGDYLFTLQNVINKRFEIERGGRLSWNGDPADANIDIKAVYRVRAPLNPLMAPFSNGTNDIYSRRIPVECQIIMKNKLMMPDISFNIDLPTADQDTRRNVQGILNNEEKRNRQFLSLLIINNFLPEQDLTGPGMGSTLGMSATEASITTVSEFFSNQLSNWLSQLSRDVDFGINWRPGDEITPDEVELALSTQVLNDRISINGHVDVGGRQTNTSNIVGDFDVDIKLNRSGKLRLKAFTRANDNLIRPHLSPYTQGVGLFYREEFDNFDELMKRYWNMVFTGRKEEDESP